MTKKMFLAALIIIIFSSTANCFTTEFPDSAKVQTLKSYIDSLKYYKDLHKYKQSVSFGEKALKTAIEIFGESDTVIAGIAYDLTFLHYSLGENNKALYYARMDSSIWINIQGRESRGYIAALFNIGAQYHSMANRELAERYYTESIEIGRRVLPGDDPSLVSYINTLGVFYKNQGKFKEAEPLYIESLEKARKIYPGDNDNLAMFLDNTAIFYSTIGNYEKSEQLYIEALGMYRRLSKGDNPDLAICLNNFSRLYMDLGKVDTAIVMLAEVLDITKRLFNGDHRNVAMILNNLGNAYETVGKYELAGKYYSEAMDMVKRLFVNDHQFKARTILNLALLYQKQNRAEESIVLIKEALEMLRRIYSGSHPDIAMALNFLTSLYESQNRLGDAEPVFKVQLELLRNSCKTQFAFLSESEKEMYWNTMKTKFLRFNSFAVSRMKENPDILCDCYDNILFSKGILINSSIKIKDNIINSSDDSLKKLYNDWIGIKKDISKFSNLSLAALSQKKINLDSMAANADAMEKKLSLSSDLLSKEYNKRQFNWQDVRKSLKKNEAAVELVRFRYHNGTAFTDSVFYAALIVRPEEKLKKNNTGGPIEIVVLENGSDLENVFLLHYQRCIKSKILDNESYSRYWEKIADRIKGVKKIYLSPDGIFNQINISSLFNPKSKKYLLETIDCQLVTSTRDIIGFNSRRKPDIENHPVVLIGNPRFSMKNDDYKKLTSRLMNINKPEIRPGSEELISMRSGIHQLPGTGREIDIIEKLMAGKGWKVEKYTDSLAVEEIVKRVNNPYILHIATHGKFLSDVIRDETEPGNKKIKNENPMLRSFLIFAGADRNYGSGDVNSVSEWHSDKFVANSEIDDGFLTAFEAQNLTLDNTELVALSACETGLGEVKNGEGVYGLQRAFIQAGAKSIIMSLWSVSDDATQELMTSFYTRWLSGKSKRQAFKEAQMELKDKYTMPYYWGAFVIIGE